MKYLILILGFNFIFMRQLFASDPLNACTCSVKESYSAQTTITIENNSRRAVELSIVGTDCKEVIHQTLLKDEIYIHKTYVGARFVVRDFIQKWPLKRFEVQRKGQRIELSKNLGKLDECDYSEEMAQRRLYNCSEKSRKAQEKGLKKAERSGLVYIGVPGCLKKDEVAVRFEERGRLCRSFMKNPETFNKFKVKDYCDYDENVAAYSNFPKLECCERCELITFKYPKKNKWEAFCQITVNRLPIKHGPYFVKTLDKSETIVRKLYKEGEEIYDFEKAVADSESSDKYAIDAIKRHFSKPEGCFIFNGIWDGSCEDISWTIHGEFESCLYEKSKMIDGRSYGKLPSKLKGSLQTGRVFSAEGQTKYKKTTGKCSWIGKVEPTPDKQFQGKGTWSCTMKDGNRCSGKWESKFDTE